MQFDEADIVQAIKKFLEDHPELRIHPGQTAEKHAALVVRHEACPCVPGRDKCPCDECLEDIQALDRCRCYFFVNSSYLKLYNDVIGQSRRVGTRRRKR